MYLLPKSVAMKNILLECLDWNLANFVWKGPDGTFLGVAGHKHLYHIIVCLLCFYTPLQC